MSLEPMNDFELIAFAREGWRRQRIADIALGLRLERMRLAAGPVAWHPGWPLPPVPRQVVQGGLF